MTAAAPKTHDIVLGLGANLGDRAANLRDAVLRFPAAEFQVTAKSGIYETAPVGPAQPDFLNAAVRISTRLRPAAVLERVLAIERALGRVRPDLVRWGPRPIDIDLLWGAGLAIDEPGLVLPHPRLLERPFALRPLVDVAPDARDPRTALRYADVRLPPLERIGDL